MDNTELSPAPPVAETSPTLGQSPVRAAVESLAFGERGAPLRVLLVGTGARAARVAHRLHANKKHLIGTLDSEVQPHMRREFPAIPHLGSLTTLRATIHTKCVDEVVVALPLRSGFDSMRTVMDVAGTLGVPVSVEMDLPLGDGRFKVDASQTGLALTQRRHRATRFPWSLVKRSLDVVVASTALVVLSPVFLAVALAIKATSSGPVLFRQARVGQHRRAFAMLKFRTMVTDAEEQRKALMHRNNATGGSFKIVDDPRIIRGGRFLRRTSLDELPQLLNVLRGEMSLVGPRPLPVWVAAEFDDPVHHRRWGLLPGMTGLWQVRGRTQEFDCMGRLDEEYADHWSIWLDLKILLKTPQAVCGGENAL